MKQSLQALSDENLDEKRSAYAVEALARAEHARRERAYLQHRQLREKAREERNKVI